jgi:diguanylate cyclase (GGDEF)-like protein
MDDKGKFSVLIVDEDQSNILVLSEILAPEYTVFTTKTGEEVPERIQEYSPDLILLNLLLPGIDGFEVLRRLKENPETMNIPVIIISGLEDGTGEEKGLLMGAVDFIVKPFKLPIVLARVKTHLQIVRQIRMIERLGLVDPLTAIANRRGFDDHIAVEWRRAQRERKSISFLMMDVDKFKNYNDTWGHPQGDALLKSLARIFCAAARRSGDLAARLGGEEFGLLLPDTDLKSAVKIAEDIRVHVERMRVPTADGKTGTWAAISIGIASCYPDKDTQIADFIQTADKYLYKAKESGRNRVCWE